MADQLTRCGELRNMTFSECVEILWMMSGSVYENAIKIQNATGFDCYKLLDPVPNLRTEAERFRYALAWLTPKVVWREYEANGYTLREAIESELSYAC